MYDCFHALVAQWIEHLASDQGIAGSNPAERTNRIWDNKQVWFSGRMRPCQGRDESSILSTCTNLVLDSDIHKMWKTGDN